MCIAHRLQLLENLALGILPRVQQPRDGCFECLQLRQLVIGVGQRALDSRQLLPQVL